MRPPGEIRAALGSAAASLSTGATWRELAVHASVGFDVARRTVENMVRAGDLTVVGTVRVPGVNRPMLRLAPLRTGQVEAGGTTAAGGLRDVVRGWADFQ